MAENPTEVTTPSAFFEELLPQGFAAQAAENPNPEDVVLQFHVSGDAGGQWTVKIAGEPSTHFASSTNLSFLSSVTRRL